MVASEERTTSTVPKSYLMNFVLQVDLFPSTLSSVEFPIRWLRVKKIFGLYYNFYSLLYISLSSSLDFFLPTGLLLTHSSISEAGINTSFSSSIQMNYLEKRVQMSFFPNVTLKKAWSRPFLSPHSTCLTDPTGWQTEARLH